MGDATDEIPSFSALESLSHLESLALEELNIKDVSLSPLTKISGLCYLSLQSVSLTDESLYHISSASKLIHLSFRDAVVTDAGLDGFTPPAAMEILDLRGCWLLSKDVLLHFCQKHPQLEVRHEFLEALDRRNLKISSPSRLSTMSSKGKKKQGRLSMSPPLRSDQFFLGELSQTSRLYRH